MNFEMDSVTMQVCSKQCMLSRHAASGHKAPVFQSDVLHCCECTSCDVRLVQTDQLLVRLIRPFEHSRSDISEETSFSNAISLDKLSAVLYGFETSQQLQMHALLLHLFIKSHPASNDN